MMRRLVRAVIQNATVTGPSNTLRLDPLILNAANILPLEEVEVVHHVTGDRFTTFAEIGAAGEVSAPRVRAGDAISIVSWGLLHDGQTLNHVATVVALDEKNRVTSLSQNQ